MAATFMLPEAMKAQQWEITKGHLRAMVALQGSYSSGLTSEEEKSSTWHRLERKVENFIKSVEDNGLQE